MTKPEDVEKDKKSRVERIQESDKPKEEKISELHRAVQDLNKSIKQLEKENKKLEFEIESDYIVLVGVSDLHYGNENVNMEYVEKILNFIGSHKRAFCFLNGDIIDNWTVVSPQGGVYEQTIRPEFQREIMKQKLEPIKDSILGIIYGNHEGRSQKAGEENPMVRMSEELEIGYLGAGGRLDIKVNDIEYKIHARHRFRYESTINPTHPCKRLIEKLDMEADVAAIGHNHDPAISLVHQGGKRRSLIRFGSALPSTRYSRYKGYGETPPVAPSVLMCSEEKLHQPLMDLKVAERYIKN